MRYVFLLLTLFPIQLFAQQEAARNLAYSQIKEMKNGVVLVRMHTDEAVVAKMKSMHQNKMLKSKLQEIESRNKEIYMAFTTGFEFTDVYFFYGRDSEKIRTHDFDNIFVGADLQVDSSITLSTDSLIYIIDVGDIYFEAYGGHFDGMIVMNNMFESLKKPFPYYVRKRSGIALLKRSYLDMVLIFEKNFSQFYKEAQHPRSH